MRNTWQLPKAAWDCWRSSRGKPAAIAAGQQARLADLVVFARAHAPFYQRLYHQIPPGASDIRLLPPVTKSELMAHFDEWVTDPAVTRAGVEEFVADKTLVGQRYLDRYAVWTTSGVTGKPGIFVHDAHAQAIYSALIGVRGYRWLTPRLFWGLLRGGVRYAVVAATEGHFTLTDYMERARRSSSQATQRIRLFSVLTPLPELVQTLNTFRPIVMVGYPSVMQVLAQEQLAGRLHLAPILVGTGGEHLAAATRSHIVEAFGCLVRDNYGASEFMHIAFECKYERLHLNTDWVILEPVDEEYRPVPAGQASHTALLTNLANRVQPLIRYDLGDRITIIPDPCPCGSPLPTMKVEGRRDEILRMPNADGSLTSLLPMALSTVVEETPGVRAFQLIQAAPTTLRIRLTVIPGMHEADVWATLCHRLHAFLSAQGILSATLERDPEDPKPHPVSGKYRQVWSEMASLVIPPCYSPKPEVK
jgi:phenylacetate-coenzyme A ligase PaaK-like adenylate-forming protein